MSNKVKKLKPETKLMKLKLPLDYANALEQLAQRENVTPEVLIFRTLGLYAMAIEAERGSYALSFTRFPETGDLTVKEIIKFDNEEETTPKLILP